MAIRTVVTRGYSTGSFTSSVALVVVRGYKFVVAAVTRKKRIAATPDLGFEAGYKPIVSREM